MSASSSVEFKGIASRLRQPEENKANQNTLDSGWEVSDSLRSIPKASEIVRASAGREQSQYGANHNTLDSGWDISDSLRSIPKAADMDRQISERPKQPQQRPNRNTLDSGWEVSDSLRSIPKDANVDEVIAEREKQLLERTKYRRKNKTMTLPNSDGTERKVIFVQSPWVATDPQNVCSTSKVPWFEDPLTDFNPAETDYDRYLKTQINYSKQVVEVGVVVKESPPEGLKKWIIVTESPSHGSVAEVRVWHSIDYSPMPIRFVPTTIRADDFRALCQSRAAAEEVNMLVETDWITLAPRTKRAIFKDREGHTPLFHCNKELNHYVRIWDRSYRYDSMKMLKMSLPDGNNYKRLHKVLLSTLDFLYQTSLIGNQEYEITYPKANFSLVIGTGGVKAICFNETATAILVMDSADCFDKTKCREKLHIEPTTSSRRLAIFELERLDAQKKAAEEEKPETERSYVTASAFNTMLVFGSTDECDRATKNADASKISYIRAPTWLLHGGVADNGVQEEFSIDLSWPDRRPTGRAVIVISDAAEMQHCRQVVHEIGWGVSFERDQEYNSNNRKIFVSNLRDYLLEPKALKDYVQRLMSANGINIEKVALIREEKLHQHQRGADTVFTVDCRILKAFIDKKIYRSALIPFTVPEYKSALQEHRRWHIRSSTVGLGRDSETHMSVTFDNVREGVLVANDLLDKRSTSPVVQMEYGQLPIRIKPRLTIRFRIQRSIRIACEEAIRTMDNEERSDKNAPFGSWTRVVDAGEDGDWVNMQVEGWPDMRVRMLYARVCSLFDGDQLDCSGDAFPLMYGLGEQWREKVRKEMGERLILDVDRFRHRLTLIGSDDAVRETKAKLLTFINQKEHVHVKTKITLSEPRWMPRMFKDVDDIVGLEQLRKIAGCPPVLKLVKENSLIEFVGSLQHLEALMDFLNKFDETMFATIPGPLRSSRPECPICLESVGDAFYCLDGCGHYYCLRCLLRQIETEIQSREFPLVCHHADCRTPLTVRDITSLVLGKREGRAATLDMLKLTDLFRALSDSLLRQVQGLSACSTPDCFGINYMNHDATEGATLNCCLCNRERCAKCALEPHPGVACRDYKEMREDADVSVRVFSRQKGGTVKRCPKATCRAVIEKDAGCNHMYCSMCKSHFCWICDFLSTEQGEVYKHLVETHGNVGEEYVIENGRVVAGPELDRFDEDWMIADDMFF